METKSNTKTKWQPGKLVIHESDPKIQCMLMEVLEVKGDRARTAYLDSRVQSQPLLREPAGIQNDGWHPLEMLQDPALFLKTEEFLQVLREHSQRR